MAIYFFEGGDRVRGLHFNGLAESMCKAIGLTPEKYPQLWSKITVLKVQSIVQQGTSTIKENKCKIHKMLARMEIKGDSVEGMFCSALLGVFAKPI